MIAFKNVFPQEFDLFQQNKGYVNQLVQNLEEIRKKYIKKLEEKLEELRDEIIELKLLTANTRYELMTLSIPAGLKRNVKDDETWTSFLQNWQEDPTKSIAFIHPNGTNSFLKFSEFNEEYLSDTEYLRKVKFFRDIDKQKSIEIYQEEIEEIKNQLNEVYNMSISDILNQMDVDNIDTFFIMNKENKVNISYKNNESDDGISSSTKHNKNKLAKDDIDYSLPSNHYFGLIRFLILDGLLDETYPDYLGYFYESSIGLNDEIFIRKLRSGDPLDEHLELDYPIAVKDKLNLRDYKKKGIYNHSLILAILDDKRDITHFLAIVEVMLRDDNKFNSFLSFLDTLSEDQIGETVQKRP